MLRLTAQALLVNFILAVPASMAGGEAVPSDRRPAAGPLEVHPSNHRYFTDGR